MIKTSDHHTGALLYKIPGCMGRDTELAEEMLKKGLGLKTVSIQTISQ
jgi:hypothetical protein